MVRHSALLQSAAKINNYIQNCVNVAGVERREEVLELFDKMQWLFPQWVIATCPMIHRDMPYITKNGPDIFGYTTEYMIANSSFEKYFIHIHEEDKKDILDCVSYMHDFLSTRLPDQHPAYRIILHYRFKKANGQYIYIHDEKAVVSLPGSGNLYYGLFRDVSSEKSFNGVKLDVFKQDEVLHKIKEYKPSAERKALSKREGELVTLIRQGLTTKEIAVYLNISPNTARNIKSKLFEKFRVSNSIELLNATA